MKYLIEFTGSVSSTSNSAAIASYILNLVGHSNSAGSVIGRLDYTKSTTIKPEKIRYNKITIGQEYTNTITISQNKTNTVVMEESSVSTKIKKLTDKVTLVKIDK